jgi:hypothetical protein
MPLDESPAAVDALMAALERTAPWDDQRLVEAEIRRWMQSWQPSVVAPPAVAWDVAVHVVRAAAGVADVRYAYVLQGQVWRALDNVLAQRKSHDDGDVLARMFPAAGGHPAVSERTRRRYRKDFGPLGIVPVLRKRHREDWIRAYMRLRGANRTAAERAYRRAVAQLGPHRRGIPDVPSGVGQETLV